MRCTTADHQRYPTTLYITDSAIPRTHFPRKPQTESNGEGTYATLNNPALLIPLLLRHEATPRDEALERTADADITVCSIGGESKGEKREIRGLQEE